MSKIYSLAPKFKKSLAKAYKEWTKAEKAIIEANYNAKKLRELYYLEQVKALGDKHLAVDLEITDDFGHALSNRVYPGVADERRAAWNKRENEKTNKTATD